MISRALVACDSPFESLLVAANFKTLGLEIRQIDNATPFDLPEISAFNPDVAYLSLGFNILGGIAYADHLRLWKPAIGLVLVSDTPILQLLGFAEKELPHGAQLILRNSVTDIFILQDALHSSVDAALNRDKMSWVKTRTSTDMEAWNTSFNVLSSTQIETFRLLAQGLSNLEIARVREVSEKSVEHIIGRIAAALNVTSSTRINQRVKLAREYFRIAGAPLD